MESDALVSHASRKEALHLVGAKNFLALQEHPVNEALFNFVNLCNLMLWPLMLADNKGVKVKNKFGIYLGTQVWPS